MVPKGPTGVPGRAETRGPPGAPPYPPFLDCCALSGLRSQPLTLRPQQDGHTLRPLQDSGRSRSFPHDSHFSRVCRDNAELLLALAQPIAKAVQSEISGFRDLRCRNRPISRFLSLLKTRNITCTMVGGGKV